MRAHVRPRRASRSLFRTLRPELERVALSGGSDGSGGHGPEVQAAAIDTLSLACFVLLEDGREAQAVMRQLQALWSRGAGLGRGGERGGERALPDGYRCRTCNGAMRTSMSTHPHAHSLGLMGLATTPASTPMRP